MGGPYGEFSSILDGSGGRGYETRLAVWFGLHGTREYAE